jgi:ribosomal protein S20
VPTAPTAPSTGGPAQPTTPQQSETQITTIITTQVTNSGAKSTLTTIVNQLKGSQAGSSSYNQALASFTETITSLEHRGSISQSTAQALRQQATYLQGFSGS